MNHYRYLKLEDPIGDLLLLADEQAVTGVELSPHRVQPARAGNWVEGGALLDEAGRQLAAYFAGHRFAFDLPLAPAGTPFQQRVWVALRAIPYGETLSYGALARRLGSPGASRAVGLANARNAIPVIVPCHRVIGANGSLTGYGGGLHRKRWLLAHEQRCSTLAPTPSRANGTTTNSPPTGR